MLKVLQDDNIKAVKSWESMQTIEKIYKKLRKYKKLWQSFKKYAKGQEIFGVWQGGSFLAYFVGDVAGRVGLGSYFLMCFCCA